MFDLTVLKTQLQARIDALTNASTFDQVIDVAIAAKKAVSAGVNVDRTIVDTQLQRVTNALGAGSAIEDLIVIAASTEGDGDSIPIGAVKKFGFAGDKFSDNNNYEWLMVGLLHTKEGYHKALNNPGLQSYGRQVYAANAVTAGRVTKAAKDGLGNIVIACGNLTHVLVSHDYGENFEAVPHNHPNRVVTVEYVGSHFILASNNSDAIRTSFSADGGESFSAATVARALSAGQTDSVRSASSGIGALFVAANDSAISYATNGTTRVGRSLPAAVSGTSYIPLVQYFGGAFYVAGKNVNGYYKTANIGESFTSHSKPAGVGAVIDEYWVVALNRFFWSGQSGSYRWLKFTTDFSEWHDLFDFIPTSIRESLKWNGGGYRMYLSACAGGIVLATPFGNYFTADLVDWKVINFSRSAEELAGSGASYFIYENLVLGGQDTVDGSYTSLNSSILLVDYDDPDYVGIHKGGISALDSEGVFNYVRIK